MPSLTTLEKYNRAALRVTAARLCQTLGWQSASSAALDVLVDVMRNYILELAKLTGRYADQFNRNLANLDDLGLALRDLGVPVAELEEYVANVEPAPFPHKLPRLPVARPTNLSFLKPGSQEIVTRPIHVYEHLPPMHPETADDELADSLTMDSPGGRAGGGAAASSGLKRPGDPLAGDTKRGRYAPEEEGRPMREILSVMMTTSGFISPAREGKLPESRLPEGLEDYGDDYRNIKTRKQRADTYRRLSERENERRNRNRDRWLPEDDLFDIIDVKVEEEEMSTGSSPEKLPTVKETAKLKPFKKHHRTEVATAKSSTPEPVLTMASPRGKASDDRAKVKKKKLKAGDGTSSKLSIFKKIAKSKQSKSSDRSAISSADLVKKRLKKKVPPTNRHSQMSGVLKPSKLADRSASKTTERSPSKSAEPPPKSAEKAPSKSGDRAGSRHADRASPKGSDRAASKPAERTAKLPERAAARPRSPSPPVVSTSSITPPGTPGTPRAPEPHAPRRKPSEVSLSELSPRSDDSGTPDRPRTPELPPGRREPPPPPPDPAALLNNPLIPRFPFPFSPAAGEPGVPAPPFPGLPGLRPPPSLFMNPPPGAAAAARRAKSPEERREKSRPMASRLLDPRRSPSDATDGSRSPSPSPDFSTLTPLKRLEMAERAEKKKEKEHKKSKKDKKDKKKKDKKDKEKKDLKMEKKEKKKKEEKEKALSKNQEARDEAVPKLTLRFGSHDSSDGRSPSPDSAPPKLVIKPVRDQAEPSTSSQVGRPSKKEKAEKKKVEETPSAQLKPPKKEKKKSPNIKPKKTASPAKAQPAAVIAETVGSFVDNEGNQIWICPECGRQDDGSPMIGCDKCDDWYHWVCVGIQVPPDQNEDWFCSRCIAKMQDSVKQKGRGRGKKK